MCTGEEQISDDNGFEMEAQLQFVSDSVMAFAHAFKVHDTRYSSPDVVCVCVMLGYTPLSSSSSKVLSSCSFRSNTIVTIS